MRGFGLGFLALALLSATSACVIAPMDGEGDAPAILSDSLDLHPGLDETSSQPSGSSPGGASAAGVMKDARESIGRIELVTGPTPDPWQEFQPGGCSSGPTPDPWNPGQPSESESRPGSASPDQGSSSQRP